MAKSGFLVNPSSKTFCLKLSGLNTSFTEILSLSGPPSKVKAIMETQSALASGLGKILRSQGLYIG